MIKEEVIWHFNDLDKLNSFAVCLSKDSKLVVKDYETPYESTYLFDTAQINDAIYFSGGGLQGNKTRPEQYFRVIIKVLIKPGSEKEIERLANMEIPRAFHGLVAIQQNFLYAIGGKNLTGELSSCEQYNIKDDIWRPVASLNEKKKFISLCSFKDKFIYSFVGDKGERQESDIIEFLDTEKAYRDFWEIVPISSGERIWGKIMLPGTVEIGSDCILIFGGTIDHDDISKTFLFFPSKNTIRKWDELKHPDSFSGAKPYQMGSRIFIPGLSGELHIYNLASREWEVISKKKWNPTNECELKAETY